MMEIEIWLFVVLLLVCLIGGAAASFFIVRKLFAKQIKENPPINEKMIRAMFKSMGRTPSEKQIREVMRNVNSQK